MFSAVGNLGAGGIKDIVLADTANVVLSGMFTISGLISGGVSNRMLKFPCAMLLSLRY